MGSAGSSTIMLADADRLQHTVEQVLKAGVAGQRGKLAKRRRWTSWR